MMESIAVALMIKNIQIVFIAVSVLIVSILSVYNLPWGDIEWTEFRTTMNSVKGKIFSISVRQRHAVKDADTCSIRSNYDHNIC